jgi:hypothetical protein
VRFKAYVSTFGVDPKADTLSDKTTALARIATRIVRKYPVDRSRWTNGRATT